MTSRRVASLMAAWLAVAAPGAAQEPAPSPPARLFAVVVRTGPGWDPALPPGQQRHFQEHSAHLARLRAEGRLALGGRFSDLGLLLLRAESEQDARALLEPDPSLAAGTFTVEVHPWSTFAPGCLEGRR